MSIQVKLFGKPQILHNGEWLTPPVSKPLCLLLYLAYASEWVSREQLAFLFWPDTDESTAKGNLRQLLSRAKKFSFANQLESEFSRIRWQVETDVAAFRHALEKQDFEEVIDLYQGALLEDVHLSDGSGFEAWLELEHSDLDLAWQEAALSCAKSLGQTERHEDAARLLRRIWHVNDYDESILQAYLRHAYVSGHKDTALAVFETFKAQLEQEFGFEPSQETKELVTAIQANQNLELEKAAPRQSLSRQHQPLVGREH